MPSIFSLAKLAPELLIQRYTSLNNAKDITVLNRTSRQFYDIWRLNSISISNTVLPHTIEQLDDAQELFEMQQKSIDQRDLDSYRKHLERTKALISNDQKIL